MRDLMKLLPLLLSFAGGLAFAADTQDPEINRAFDRGKGRLYAEYAKALKVNPRLQGKIIFEIDIATTGDVSACRVQFSNLGDADLNRRLCDRMSQLKFKPRAAPITVSKTADFFPAA
jgi:hypothetical protein